jgi:general secretion pathway protein D
MAPVRSAPSAPRGRALRLPTILGAVLLVGCVTAPLPIQQADRLALEGRSADAWALLREARRADPASDALRAAELRARARAISQWVLQGQAELGLGRLEAARALLKQAEAADAGHPRVAALRRLVAEREGAAAAATATAAPSASAPPSTAVAPATAAAPLPHGPNISLDFRDAPLKAVFDSLARAQGLNFVFDRDVRGEQRLTLALRDTPLPEALRVLLATQQLAAKPLNERTWFVYPDNAGKQREHRELLVRGFYLSNADARQAQALLRSLARTRELHVDERLNLIVVRDSAEGLALAEQLLAAIDLPEPEVVLEVEVLEIASSRLLDLGIQWPDQIAWGLPGAGDVLPPATVAPGRWREFSSAIANPALLATLRETLSQSDTLANPRLRTRNREKARVLVGEKLPVFTTTATAGVGSSSTVSYLDVGLKLEVEPQVLLEGDVAIKVALEVSTLIGRVAGPQGAIGYQVGTREASTTLRLRDGETQILAGLIRDEDSRSSVGLPGLAGLPVLGRLFGLHNDARRKTEIVLLITPRIVRAVQPPASALLARGAGSEAMPGAAPWRLAPAARVALAMSGRGAAGSGAAATAVVAGADNPAAAPAPGGAAAAAEREVALRLNAAGEARVGAVVAVTVENPSDTQVEAELVFDPRLAQAAQAGAGAAAAAGAGRVAFRLGPGGQFVLPLRVLAAAAGGGVVVALDNVVARDARGDAVAAVSGSSVNIAVANGGSAAPGLPSTRP